MNAIGKHLAAAETNRFPDVANVIQYGSGHKENQIAMSIVLEYPATPNAPVSARRPRRLLLIAYNFPPVGGAGVQRPVKWVKNLRQFGWDVTVLTTENPSVPVRDESLLADIPYDIPIVRARTWEPDYQTKKGLVEGSRPISRGPISRVKSLLRGSVQRVAKLMLQPDPQVLWVANAIQAGRRILRDAEHDAILVTAPPYSSFFIGRSLKRQFGLPLVLDFRDEWDMSGRYLENAQRDVISHFIQQRMQRHLLKQADAVVATTIASATNLAEKLGRLNRSATPAITVYNGFDSEEFATESEMTVPRKSAECASSRAFRLLYAGTLWNLTTIQPLVDAIVSLNSKAPELVANLELVCVGRKTVEQIAELERLKTTACRLELIDYCDHSKALDWLRSADALCLLLSDVPGAERVVPAKLFEYFASRKDMLAIVPRGETANIVNHVYPGGAIEPKDVASIAQWLKARLSGESQKQTGFARSADINVYSRTAQTRRLVDSLDALVENEFPTRRAAR